MENLSCQSAQAYVQITISWRLNQQPLSCPRRLEVKVTVPADMVQAEASHLGSQRAALLQCPIPETAEEVAILGVSSCRALIPFPRLHLHGLMTCQRPTSKFHHSEG